MKIFFVVISLLISASLLSGKFYFYKHENRFVRERSVAFGTILLTLYIFSALIMSFYVESFYKPIMLFCAFSPFVIGHFSTYKRLLFFTILQMLVILCSIGVVFIG